MSNIFEIKKILTELKMIADGRKLIGKKPLSFDLRLENVELLLSEFAINHDISVPLPEFLTSNELFELEMILG